MALDEPHSPRRHWLRAALVLTAVLAVLPASSASAASAQDVGPDQPETPFNQGTFRFAARARGILHGLWASSIEAREERVACLGGYVYRDVVYITRVEPLESIHADSANISALPSLRLCGPPEWLGTVHTHIAKFHGQPYIVFSGPDRFVMGMWRERWKTPGVFCILYSEFETNCELGNTLSSPGTYGYSRGNNLVF
ncbi:MAG TPA: hypothetical protein VIQ74_05435 [Gemmatimonadaceae bacterium]|jgi:hypothetical protein